MRVKRLSRNNEPFSHSINLHLKWGKAWRTPTQSLFLPLNTTLPTHSIIQFAVFSESESEKESRIIIDTYTYHIWFYETKNEEWINGWHNKRMRHHLSANGYNSYKEQQTPQIYNINNIQQPSKLHPLHARTNLFFPHFHSLVLAILCLFFTFSLSLHMCAICKAVIAFCYKNDKMLWLLPNWNEKPKVWERATNVNNTPNQPTNGPFFQYVSSCIRRMKTNVNLDFAQCVRIYNLNTRLPRIFVTNYADFAYRGTLEI